MKKIKNAFTLIELLAVIIILAIIALIATPIILDVVEDARISAGKSEAQMILGGINNYCATEDVKYQLNNSYTKICTTDMDVNDVPTMVNLGNADIINIKYNGTQLTELVIKSNNHKFTLCPSGQFAMDDESCEGEVGLVGTSIIEKVKELVYENGACKTDGSTYQYMGGCYIKRNSTNNYIWYSGFLWRIMGINADGTVRMITDENVTAIPYHNSSSNWDGSYAKDWLNNYFYPRLKGNDIIVEQIWCSDVTDDYHVERTECTPTSLTAKAKVGMLTVDEYQLAETSISYLDIGQWQWTMTPKSNSSRPQYINSVGNQNDNGQSYSNGLRAVINVKNDAIITGGDGTIGQIWNREIGPYILNEDKNIEIKGKLSEKATNGEYVMFAGKKYRVVDKDSNGNIKIILDGYYEENGTIYEMEYGNYKISTTTGIGQKLNTDVLEWLVSSNDTENRNKIVSNYTWYQQNFSSGSDYNLSLDETNSINSINAPVGLIRVGEMLSGQSSSILTNGYNFNSNGNNANYYWTMTTCSSSVWRIESGGGSSYSKTSYLYSIRPVIVIKSDVNITSGSGIWNNPYQI